MMSLHSLRWDKLPLRRWIKTTASRYIDCSSELNLSGKLFVGYTYCSLLNGDKCQLDDWVIVRSATSLNSFSIGKVVEILQFYGSNAEILHQPDLILIHLYAVSGIAEMYQMPQLVNGRMYALLKFKVGNNIFVKALHLYFIRTFFAQ